MLINVNYKDIERKFFIKPNFHEIRLNNFSAKSSEYIIFLTFGGRQ